MSLTSPFTIDLVGIAAAFLGGDEATSAMATVLFYEGRKWARWYNTPGSFEIARQYGLLAKQVAAGATSKGSNSAFLATLGLEGEPGGKYRALYSGTRMEETSHMAYLLEKECERRKGMEMIEERVSAQHSVTVVNLGVAPPGNFNIAMETCLGPLDFIPVIVSVCTILA